MDPAPVIVSDPTPGPVEPIMRLPLETPLAPFTTTLPGNALPMFTVAVVVQVPELNGTPSPVTAMAPHAGTVLATAPSSAKAAHFPNRRCVTISSAFQLPASYFVLP